MEFSDTYVIVARADLDATGMSDDDTDCVRHSRYAITEGDTGHGVYVKMPTMAKGFMASDAGEVLKAVVASVVQSVYEALGAAPGDVTVTIDGS